MRVSRVYRLYQLSLLAPSGHYSSSALTSALPLAAHALPTSIYTGTMDEIEDSGDKDFQLRPGHVMLGGPNEGGVFRGRGYL